MKDSGGYVRLYRSLLDHPLVTQLPAAWFRIFIVVLLRVNWKPGLWWDGSRNVEIPAGSMVTSVDKLSRLARASTKQTRGALEYFKTANIAAIRTTSQYSIITVTNWNVYQNQDDAEGKPFGEQKGKPGANQGQTEGKLGGNNRRNQEGKNIRREEDYYTPTSSSNITSHPETANVQDDVEQQAYVDRIRARWGESEFACNGWTATNEAIARQQFRAGIDVQQLENAITWAAAMRYKSMVNNGNHDKIQTLTYAVNALEAEDFIKTTPAQIEHFRRRFGEKGAA